jgi:hypothetical protein
MIRLMAALAASSRRSWRRTWRFLTLLAMVSGTAHAQLPVQDRPLANDSYLPVSTAAAEKLQLGDAEVLRALEGGAAAKLAWTRAFEAWSDALELSVSGDCVPTGFQLSDQDALVEAYQQLLDQRWPDRDRSFGRRTEAVEYAVLRRLCGIDPEHVALWTARFEPLAQARLEQLSLDQNSRSRSRATALAIIERRFPATRSAMAASLMLFGLELEEGRLHAARNWLERAQLHAQLSGESASVDVRTALDRRSDLLRSLSPSAEQAPPAWTRAAEFVPSEGHPLVLPGRSKPRAFASIEGQPGLAFLDDERIAIQTTGTLWILSEKDEDRIFEPWRLGFELGHPIPRTVDRAGKDWPMFPVADGESLYLVCGRADGKSSNLLQKIRTPYDLELPIAEWSLGGAGLRSPDGPDLPLDQVLEEGMWEFQPGPLLVEDVLFVQARQWTRSEKDDDLVITTPGEARLWLLALDASTGRPRWKRFLGRGTDLVLDFGIRFGSNRLIRTPGAALQATDRTLFVGTNLGAGFLMDLADGRLRWSFRNRRRDPQDPGWRGGQRPGTLLDSSAESPVVLWAPADADELYPLGTALDFGPPALGAVQPIMTTPPLSIEESELLVGGTPVQTLILGRAGPRKTLSAHDLTSGRRYDSIYLGREEEFLPGPLISEDRLLFASEDGLYLLDRDRELYLASFQPLAMESDFAPGGLWTRGETLYLLAQGALYSFEVR